MLLLMISSKCILLLVGDTGVGDNLTGAKSFNVFLNRFTSDAAFQYAHIKFPIGELDLLDSEADAQGLIEMKAIPFTKELWILHGKGAFSKKNEGGLKAGFKWMNDRKVTWSVTYGEVESGYSYSESLTFEYIDGDWYVTQGYYENGTDTPTYVDQVEIVKQANDGFK